MPRGSQPAEGEPREVLLCIRVTPSLAKQMDEARGKVNRSDFARDAIREASRKK